ncbi:TIGR00270 family protein [Candidatus Woesearchaeota archaeon]|nr:TIGR00270 family protein [Candidatus Woesearchaeota archaeon]
MAACEMCGKISNLVTADIEGSVLRVCAVCASYGQIRRAPSEATYRRAPVKTMPQEEFEVISHYGSLLQKERSKRKLTQTDFAALLQERESVVAKWEAGSLKPDLDVARRIGKILGINFVVKQGGGTSEEKQDEKGTVKKGAAEFTLGDFVKVRKRK